MRAMIKKWFFSLTTNIRVLALAIIAMVLLWGAITPIYLVFLDWMEGLLLDSGLPQDTGVWVIVIICFIGLGILGKYGKRVL